jgi:hypothetical protein
MRTTESPPPLGIRPRWCVVSMRMEEIADACVRYSRDNLTIPHEWLAELSELNCWLIDYKKKENKECTTTT